jgi:uncharacterized protein (TIGR02466 family)
VNSNVSLEPLFPSPLFKTKLIFENNDELKQNIIRNHKNHKKINDSVTANQNAVLGLENDIKFLDIKCEIEKIISSTLKEIYQSTDIDFYICSMWSTCCLPKESGQDHFHSNSFYSGVFYPFEVTPSELSFYSPLQDKFSLDLTGNIKNWNHFNSPSYNIQPEQFDLIFFPSYLYHKVLKNKSNITRYSLAFNIFLKGNLKAPTSSLFLT